MRAYKRSRVKVVIRPKTRKISGDQKNMHLGSLAEVDILGLRCLLNTQAEKPGELEYSRLKRLELEK